VPAFLTNHRKRILIIALGGCALLLAVGLLAFAIVSPRLTPWIEGPKFREMLDRQTSKGLHFTGRYDAIERTGATSVATAGFQGHAGVKAMKSLEAHDVTATFNPWGFFLRRWQLDSVHIKRGIVEVQTYVPKPDPPKNRLWYAIFMPDRVYLREVTCDDADVTWRMNGGQSGIFHTQLLITPYGRDFEYHAKGGELRSDGLAPEMKVAAIHMLITKTILQVYQFELETREGGTIQVTGDAGMRDEKHVDAKLQFDGLAIAPWLPRELSAGVKGRASGQVTWKAPAQTLEASTGAGEVHVTEGELDDLPVLDYLAAATGRKTLEKTRLDQCEVKFRWDYPKLEITSLDLVSKEKFALRGQVSVSEGGALGGILDLGMAPDLLHWLPRAKADIFTREEGGMIWTKVRLSGTLSKPENDLVPRLARALKRDPGAAAGLFFRGLGEWLEQKSRGR